MHERFQFQQLRQFLVVARVGSFTRAAEELNLSQPTLSRSIQSLETQIGQPLFERMPRKVVLTDVGHVLFERARQIIELVDDTFKELSDSNHLGRVRLAVIPTIAPFLLPQMLRDFSRKYPDVSVIVQEDTTRNIVRMCRHGEVDLAIVALPISEKYLEVEPLFEEELVLVVPNGHVLEKKRTVRLADIKDFPLVMLDQAHCLSDNIESFCKRESIDPISIERTSQLATVQELVSLSHGISLVPRMAARLDQTNRRIYRSFSGEKPQRTIALLTNPYRFQGRWVKTFIEHLRQLTG